MYEKLTLASIDQVEAWSIIIGQTVQVGKSHLYCSPIRVDHKPKCYFEWYGEVLFLVDFANRLHKCVSCVQAWSIIRKVSSRVALRELYNKQLGKRTPLKKINKPKPISKQIKPFDYTEIWTQEHEAYWAVRGVKKSNKITGASSYTQYFDDKSKTTIVNDLCFIYKHEVGTKVYFPNRRKPRFISSVQAVATWTRVTDTSVLVITKSHKEYLELEALTDYNLFLVQSETSYDVHVEYLKSLPNEKIVFFDNDDTGIECGLDFAQKINGKLCFIPKGDSINSPYLNLKMVQYCNGFNSTLQILGVNMSEYRRLKDIDDYVMTFGPNLLPSFLKELI